MEILCALPCLISVKDKKGFSIGGAGLNGFNVKTFPFRPQFKIFLAFKRTPEDTSTPHFDFQIFDEMGNTYLAQPRRFVDFNGFDMDLRTIAFSGLESPELPAPGTYQLTFSCGRSTLRWPLKISTVIEGNTGTTS